ncbi:hypothetical protein [Hoylesella loescheii]|uniref:hypothetical protein n=1 Tax=Hoylesella loescheii TaxID=840 RepID=UPI00248E02A3|nr:hypothetical protein [Hoylesella loescheii]
MNNKTFKELYEAERDKPTAAQHFIATVAEITHRSTNTVKMWLTGRQVPDELARTIMAQHFRCDAEQLFPTNN